MSPTDVARQLLTGDVDGPRASAMARGVVRSGSAFVGNLWDVYARRISSYSPSWKEKATVKYRKLEAYLAPGLSLAEELGSGISGLTVDDSDEAGSVT